MRLDRPPYAECEPAAQRQIDHRDGAVGHVHRADYVQVGRQMHALFLGLGIGQRERVLLTALVRLHQRQRLAENLRGVASVNLLNDHHVVVAGVGLGGFDDFKERAIDERKLAISTGTKASYEVLVREARMKL